jgi:predicted small metal-binding protein
VAVSTTCKGCGIEFTAEDEDELATQVQAHIAEAHASGHAPTKEQVLAVIRARQQSGAE